MEEKKVIEKNALAVKGLKAISELEESVKLENIIKDNKIEFDSNGEKYRVKEQTLTEQNLIDTARRKKYLELINDDACLFKKQWIKKYKEKDIDIDKMEKDVIRIQNEIKTLLLKLAKTNDDKSVETLKKEINKLREEQYAIVIEKTDLLSYSIEDQLNIYMTSYTAYTVLEKLDKKDNKWKSVFESYQEFLDSNNIDLVNKALYFLDYLLYGSE